jgi:preprotein translocase subunit SecY
VVPNFVNNSITPDQSSTSRYYGLLIFAVHLLLRVRGLRPHQQADIIRKQGGYIPGIRPGPPTERYFARILNRITVPGASTSLRWP